MPEDDQSGGGNGAAIGTIAGAVIALAGLYAQNRQNKKNRENQEFQNFADRVRQDQYELLRRKHAKQDFNTQNQYNSPEQQMIRLRQAGLSPMLVYGKGADNTAQQIKETQAQYNQSPVSKYDTSGTVHSLEAFQQGSMIGAQTDNLHAQNTLMGKEGLLKEANIAKILQDTARSKWDWEQADRIKDMVVERTYLENETTRQNLGLNFDANNRAEIANSANVALTIQKIVTEKLQQGKTAAEQKQINEVIENINLDQKIKEYDVKLKHDGLQPNDPVYIRLMSEMLSKLTGNIMPFDPRSNIRKPTKFGYH